MSPRDQSTRRIHEVQEALVSYQPSVGATDMGALGGLCKLVLASVDVRDLKGVSAPDFIALFEQVLHRITVRRAGDSIVSVQRVGDALEVLTCTEDQPFLVSAVRALLASERLELKGSLNAVGAVKRDAQGKLREFGAGVPESIIRIVVRAPDGADPTALEGKLRERIRLAKAMVRDFEVMRRHVLSAADDYLRAPAGTTPERQVELRETEALMRWLCDESFVLFSVEEFDLAGERAVALGATTVANPARDRAVIVRVATGENPSGPVRYIRGTEDAPVHRAGKPGLFVIQRLGQTGEAVGAIVIEGLFTYKALHTPPETVPHVRAMLRALLADREVGAEGYRGKAITNAFNSLPLEFLLTQSQQAVWELTDRVLRAEEEGGSDVEMRIAPDRGSAYVFVTLPREQFSEELRVQLQRTILTALGANYVDYGVYIDRYANAIVHFYVTPHTTLPEVDLERLSAEVQAMAKSWPERLKEALHELGDEGQVDALVEVYEEAFSEEHRRRAGGERLRRDILCLESLRGGQPFDVDLYLSTTGDHPGSVNLRVFSRQTMNLSKQLPVIVNFGLEVVDSYMREVRIAHLGTVEMHNFRLDVRRDRQQPILSRRDEINRAISAVFGGALGDDRLNRLVSASSLTGTDVEILRALSAYAHQLRAPFSRAVIEQALVDHPNVAQALIGLLVRRFDPAVDATPSEIAIADEALTAELRAVSDYVADRALQGFAQILRAIRRTNAFLPRAPGGAGLAFKIATGEVAWAPEPKPFREIWVYDAHFEGVHLRGGKVARGGLRFSDRPEDFRTEILGLMATQMVKNVLIVPVGAKGGFVLRTPPTGRAELRAAGDAVYERFITSLLSITDNVVDGKTYTPPGVRQTEGDDPYLVVAADKGTAHLSDTANRISMAHHFWMDDAFASGGSNGYDHKATGITARGAWEAAKRNFREIGIDPEVDPITAIGVGDMSGDVFGNGLLRSRTVKLLGAFNHIHVFVDPTPDPALSFHERQRLFDKPGSAWTDYDPAKLSPGGGVFDRKAKEVALSAEARAMLGFDASRAVSGEDVIRAIMRMPVDLCWMGGIGTYVKASSESHADVGDKANDAVRVNARELRCKVFAEGANLAITERGRVEFARAGGSNYTAFLDNSGGVDTSDHEVNLKILFSPLLVAGTVTRERRNELLRAVQDEICEMVIGNNRTQSRMVSYDTRRSVRDLWRYQRTTHYLAERTPFDRDAFAMPSDEEIGARFRRGEGLYKCETAVLGSHSKMLVFRLLTEEGPLEPWLQEGLIVDYFPARIVAAVGADAVRGHLLYGELAATTTVNHIVDNAGASFFPELMQITGRSAREVATAYLAAARAAGLRDLLTELYALEDAQRQSLVYEAMEEVQLAMEETAFDLIDLNRSVDEKTVDDARALVAQIAELLPSSERAHLATRATALAARGMPDALARRVVALQHLDLVFDAVFLAEDTGRKPQEMLGIRLDLFARLGLVGLTEALRNVRLASPWEGPAIDTLTHQIDLRALRLTELAVERGVAAVWDGLQLGRVREQIDRILSRDLDIAAVVMLDAQLRRIVASARA